MNSLTDESSPLLEVHAVGTLSQGDERDDAPAETNFRGLATWWVVVATLVRFVCVAALPVGNGEAYYYSWSRFLDWSYYDHPPLVAWMARLTTALGTSPAAVHLGPILASAAFGLLFYRLAERLFRPRTAFFALVLVTALPVFLFSSFVLNPEAPLAPLWVGFLVVLEGMRKRDGWHRPLLAGVLLGFAFLAKYTAVLLVPAALIYVACSAPTRRWLRRPSFYAGGAVALVIALPVLIWNQARGWPSVRLHLVERASAAIPVAGENRLNQMVAASSTGGTGHLETFARVLVGQIISYSPVLVPLLAIALVGALRRARRDDRDLFLTAFSWPVLAPLLLAMTGLQDAEQHWTMMAVMPAAIAAGRVLDESWDRARRFRRAALVGVGLTAVGFVISVLHARTTAVLRFLPAAHYDARADIVNELVGWDEVRASVSQAANAAPGTVVLASNHYSLCGRLLFEMGDQPSVYCPAVRRSAFDFFDRRDPPASATVVVVTTDIHDERPVGLEGRKCTPADQVDVERGGRHVARYLVQTCPPVPSHEEDRASRD
jgi:4-amino-4-deoxy-L-arabinose transferase-like glycosyltransferase